MAFIVKIPIKKAKAELEVNVEEYPPESQQILIVDGLGPTLNLRQSSLPTLKAQEALSEKDVLATREKAMQIAQQIHAELLAGTFRKAGRGAAKEKGLDKEVKTMAMNIARAKVRDLLKKAKKKISHYKVSQISAVAAKLMEQDPTILVEAKAAIEAQKARPADMSLIAGLQESPDLVAKDLEKKAKAKAEKEEASEEDILSAVQAGKPLVKPRAQPTAH